MKKFIVWAIWDHHLREIRRLRYGQLLRRPSNLLGKLWSEEDVFWLVVEASGDGWGKTLQARTVGQPSLARICPLTQAERRDGDEKKSARDRSLGRFSCSSLFQGLKKSGFAVFGRGNEDRLTMASLWEREATPIHETITPRLSASSKTALRLEAARSSGHGKLLWEPLSKR